MTRRSRAWVGLLAATTAASVHVSSSRADVKEACATAYEQAQRLSREERYDLARAQLAICVQTCPTALSKDCERWSRQVDDAMASVVLEARDRNGQPLTEARVSMDGKPLAERIDGREVLVEPGTHTFRFELPSGAAEETRATLARGAKDQHVIVTFAIDAPTSTPPTPPPVATAKPDASAPPHVATSTSGPPGAFYVLGAVGIAGLGVGAAFGIKGHLDKAHLQDSCAPDCSAGKVDTIRMEWVVAGIAAGAGLLAVGGAVIVLASAPATAPTGSAGGRRAVWLGVRPDPSGGFATAAGSF